MIKAVIFDMDGILIDTENLWQEAEKNLLAEVGVELSDSDLAQSRGLMSSEMVQHWCNHFGLDTVDRKAMEDRYNAQMVEKFRSGAILMEGALYALDFFRSRGLPLALASCSTHAHIDAAIEKFNLEKYFVHRVSAAEGMPGKPHPEIYLQTANRLGVEPVYCLAIEDSFLGLISALAARMKVISMPDHSEYDQSRFSAAHEKIKSLREINDALFKKIAAP